VDLADLAQRLRRGVGLWRQEGLGQVDVAPSYLSSLHPIFERAPAESPPVGAAMTAERPNQPLAIWMENGARQRVLEAAAFAEPLTRQRAALVRSIMRDPQAAVRWSRAGRQWNGLALSARAALDAAPEPFLADRESPAARPR